MTAQDESVDARPPIATWEVAAVAVMAGTVAVLSACRYGYYYDELYFIAAGKRLAWSYVDQGPLVPLLARGMDWLVPGSFAALRIPAIIAAVVIVVFGAVIARELGGGRVAQVLAAAACATSVCALGQNQRLTTNGIDTALWVLLAWLIVCWVRTRRDALLLGAGVVSVAALEVKWLVPVFWVVILVAAGCLGPRALLRRPALWCSTALVVVGAIPMLVWQAKHGWPQVGMGAVVRGQTTGLAGGVLTFLPRVAEMCGPLGVVLLVYGVWRLWRSPRLRPYRFVGLAFVLMVIIFAATGGRTEYGAGLYVAVMVAGAVELGAAVRSRRAVVAVAAAVAVSIATFVVWQTPWRSASQLTPAADFAAGVNAQAYGEFGWRQLTAAVAIVYQRLAPEQRRTAVIVTERYIQASALDYDRNAAALPAIYSPKRGFGYFGTPPDTAETVIWVGSTAPDLQKWFTSVVPASTLDVRLGMPLVTRDITIWTCTHPRQPWSSLWPKMMNL
ncbi:glycosyl transferase family 39 [Mycolicibacterium aromaticivorans JS19b1 = JCM 16368]|uniref:Glycosyl transferase family 39 n=2 Tax=Mycolicibacterium aromaticivorans TaxID=318425 RepID=A0A064C7W8_9MYCO|nr:glycosyl transferase family 39 [Mycolicibacterium aromaticivorans JS19b1 = JCM 16368]